MSNKYERCRETHQAKQRLEAMINGTYYKTPSISPEKKFQRVLEAQAEGRYYDKPALAQHKRVRRATSLQIR
ncbi:hypothetical protein HY345_01755 [Candidatus Microgenomates bacterium]|nr:hypothetical protein [Candidatus Microgenomates bacterium]